MAAISNKNKDNIEVDSLLSTKSVYNRVDKPRDPLRCVRFLTLVTCWPALPSDPVVFACEDGFLKT